MDIRYRVDIRYLADIVYRLDIRYLSAIPGRGVGDRRND